MLKGNRLGIGGVPIGAPLDETIETNSKIGIGGHPIGTALSIEEPSNPKLGIGGILIGNATDDQQTPRQAVPCSDFMNTLNKESVSNLERWSNAESALNTEKAIEFKSTDDIISILQNHPDFSRLPPDSLQPFIASLLSALAIGGGITLTICTGGIGAVASGESIGAIIQLAAGSVLTSAGATGMQTSIKGGIKGNFKWKNWANETSISALVSVIVFPITLGSGIAIANSWSRSVALFEYGNIIINAKMCENGALAQAYLHNCIRTATTLVNATLQAGADSIQRVVREGKVNIASIILSLAAGAWSGFNVGNQIAQSTVNKILEENMQK